MPALFNLANPSRDSFRRDIIAVACDILAHNAARPARCCGVTFFRQQIPVSPHFAPFSETFKPENYVLGLER